jgi:hypothetical protein
VLGDRAFWVLIDIVWLYVWKYTVLPHCTCPLDTVEEVTSMDEKRFHCEGVSAKKYL